MSFPPRYRFASWSSEIPFDPGDFSLFTIRVVALMTLFLLRFYSLSIVCIPLRFVQFIGLSMSLSPTAL
jgi:hypothetical protein